MLVIISIPKQHVKALPDLAGLDYCPPTATGTSIIPTFGFPTFVWPTLEGTPHATSTACVAGPGVICPPTGTPLPTNTPTLTPSPTITATPVTTANITGFGHSEGSPSCTIAGDGQSAHCTFNQTYSGVATWNVNQIDAQVAGSGTLYMLVNMGSSGASSTNIHIYQAWYVQSAAAGVNVVQDYFNTAANSTWSALYSYPFSSVLTDMGLLYALYPTSNASDSVYGSIDWYLNPAALTPTVTPSPTATGTGPCTPLEDTVISDSVSYTAPSISIGTVANGRCHDIIPNLTFDVPSLVQDASEYVPATIGIPGITVCLDYWSMNLTVFGFNVITWAGVLCGMIGVIMIYRQIVS